MEDVFLLVGKHHRLLFVSAPYGGEGDGMLLAVSWCGELNMRNQLHGTEGT